MKALSLAQPHAIIMVGIPGSGKTHFASKFSDTFNAPFINLDTLLPLALDIESAAQIAESQLKELLKTKQSILIEVNTATRQNRTELSKIVREAGYVPLIVWVQTDKVTAKKRVAKKDANFDELEKKFSPPHEKEHPTVISGKHTYASQAKTILQKLSAPRTTRSELDQQPHRTKRAGSIMIQ